MPSNTMHKTRGRGPGTRLTHRCWSIKRRRLGAPCCPHPSPSTQRPKEDSRRVSVEASSPSSQSRRNGDVIQEAAFPLPTENDIDVSDEENSENSRSHINQSRFTAGKRRSRTKRISHSVDERKSSSTVRLQCGKTISRGRNKCLSKSEGSGTADAHARQSLSTASPPTTPASAKTRPMPLHLIFPRTLLYSHLRCCQGLSELKSRITTIATGTNVVVASPSLNIAGTT